MSLWIASGDSETYQLSKFSLLDLQEKSIVSQTRVKPVLNDHSKIDKPKIIMTNDS